MSGGEVDNSGGDAGLWKVQPAVGVAVVLASLAAAVASAVAFSASASRFQTSGRNCSIWLIGVWPILASTLVRYSCGLSPCCSALASNVHSLAWLVPAASLPAKYQFFLPIATRF